MENEVDSSDELIIPTKKAKKSKTVNLSADKLISFDILRTYFDQNKETTQIHCLVPNCNGTVSRWQLYYFKRHFETKHRNLLNELFPEQLSLEKQREIEVCELIYDAVELVTINGCAFSVLDSSAFKNIIKPRLIELERHGYKVTINRHMITQKIAEVSELIRKEIKNEFQGKMVNILFDICTKRTLSVLGVSATTMTNDKVIARSLGIIQLKERHRGPYLADIIERLLKEYNISSRQLYTGTADNASNNDTTMRIISLHAANELDNVEEATSEDDERMNLDDSEEDICMEMENQIELHNELNNDNRYIELINEMTENLLRRANFLSPAQRVNCCAHTTQLGANAALKNSDAKDIIHAVREMTKTLRTVVVNIEFRKLAPNCILPRQHVDTRWNTDFIMVTYNFCQIFIRLCYQFSSMIIFTF